MSWYEKFIPSIFSHSQKTSVEKPKGDKTPSQQAAQTSPEPENFFGMTPEALTALAAINQQANSGVFNQTVEKIKAAVDSAAKSSPDTMQGAKLPKPSLLYSSKFAGESDVTVILLPEQHIYRAQDPLRETRGICPYAAKVQNCFLLKALFDDKELGIKDTLHEASVALGQEVQSDFTQALNETRIPAAAYANHLSLSHGGQSIPTESIEEDLRTNVQRFTLLSQVFVESRLPPEKRSFTDHEITTLIVNFFGVKDMTGLTQSMSIVAQDANHILEKAGLDKEQSVAKFTALLKEVEQAIAPHNYLYIDPKTNAPNFNYEKYSEINKNARRAFLNYLNTLADTQALKRDEAMADKIKSCKGVLPMVIGVAHIPNLISELEARSIPVCVIGPECYHSMMGVDINAESFKSDLLARKNEFQRVTNQKLGDLRKLI